MGARRFLSIDGDFDTRQRWNPLVALPQGEKLSGFKELKIRYGFFFSFSFFFKNIGVEKSASAAKMLFKFQHMCYWKNDCTRVTEENNGGHFSRLLRQLICETHRTNSHHPLTQLKPGEGKVCYFFLFIIFLHPHSGRERNKRRDGQKASEIMENFG